VILILYIYVVDQITWCERFGSASSHPQQWYKKEFEFLIFGQTWCEFWCQDL